MTAALNLAAEGRFAMKAVCETLGVARSNIAARATGTIPEPEGDLRFPTLIWLLRSRRSLKKCRPMAIGGSCHSKAQGP